MFAEVAVEGGVPWLAEALERHLSFWSGAAPPAAVCRWGATATVAGDQTPRTLYSTLCDMCLLHDSST